MVIQIPADCTATSSYPCSQAQEELRRLLEAHELRNRLRHHGDELLHSAVQLDVFLPYDLPYVRVGQLQGGGHQAEWAKGKDACVTTGEQIRDDRSLLSLHTVAYFIQDVKHLYFYKMKN